MCGNVKCLLCFIGGVLLVSGGYTLLYHIIRICQGGESVIELGMF